MIIGICGSIGSGKSAVGTYIAKRYPVADADVLAKDVLRVGQAGYTQVIEAFGANILAPDQSIDRTALSNLVFHQPLLLKKLEDIIHPNVIHTLLAQAKAYAYTLFFWEVPLLFESGLDAYCDAIICVYAEDTLRIARVMERSRMSKEAVLARMAVQMPQEELRRRSTYQLCNDGAQSELHPKIDAILHELEQKRGT